MRAPRRPEPQKNGASTCLFFGTTSHCGHLEPTTTNSFHGIAARTNLFTQKRPKFHSAKRNERNEKKNAQIHCKLLCVNILILLLNKNHASSTNTNARARDRWGPKRCVIIAVDFVCIGDCIATPRFFPAKTERVTSAMFKSPLSESRKVALNQSWLRPGLARDRFHS